MIIIAFRFLSWTFLTSMFFSGEYQRFAPLNHLLYDIVGPGFFQGNGLGGIRQHLSTLILRCLNSISTIQSKIGSSGLGVLIYNAYNAGGGERLWRTPCVDRLRDYIRSGGGRTGGPHLTAGPGTACLAAVVYRRHKAAE